MLHHSILKINSPLGSNVYFVNSNPAVIIDTGHPSIAQETVELLKNLIPIDNIGYILSTHSHPDHIGATALLKKLTLAKVCSFTPAKNDKLTSKHKQEIKLDFSPFKVDHFLKDGECIRLHDDTVQVLFTPGHADDHCCFYFTERRFLFTGDLIVREDIGFLNLNKPYHDAINEMNSSINLCAKIPAKRIFPGHGDPYRIAPWDKQKRKLLLFEKNPQLLIAHILISPFLFYLWVQGPTTVQKCEQYVADHTYLFDGFIENIDADRIIQEFRKLLSLFEILNIIKRNGDLIQGCFPTGLSYQWYK